MKFKAKWIWNKQRNYRLYNQTIIAKKSFKVGGIKSAVIGITADSYYRLYINQQWVNDGPARCWPEHYQYDQIDVSPYIQKGENEIVVVAKYAGVGDFKKIPQQAGLLVQLDVKLSSGSTKSIVSDKSWQTAAAKQWISNTPKISAQRGPCESYDARLEDSARFKAAVELFAADKGPWKGLTQRSTGLLTKKPYSFRRFLEANVVASERDINFCVCGPRLVYPDLIEANMHAHVPFGMATIITVKESCKLKIVSEAWRTEHFQVTIDGKLSSSGRFNLKPGRHFVLAINRCTFVHDKDSSVRFVDAPKMKFENPLDSKHENPWCYISFDEFSFADNDLLWQRWFEANPQAQKKVDDYTKLTLLLLKKIKDKKGFFELLKDRSKCMPAEKMFVQDCYWQFRHRDVVASGSEFVKNPVGLMHDNAETTIVSPAAKGDVEIVYDLGQQNYGYYSIDLISEAGVQVDIFGIEYKNKQGRLQHTVENRNGVRYVTKEGVNQFISCERRSSRYIYITIRKNKKPVKIRNISLIESTYPVDHVGSFDCSDARLSKVWEISERTLKLCMEDTFVDCPTYEQVYWTGDARNEALFAFYGFGATDIAERCLKISAESLERYELVGCQVPTSWDSIIPIWSFLWGMAVWDYYWYTGDKKLVKQMFKPVIKNLKGAESYINEDGLFSAPLWNLFDWADIDHDHKTVLHNSMFMIGAIDVAPSSSIGI